MFSLLPVTVWVEAVTGERWAERVRLFETVAELKKRIWRRKRISTARQALVFCGRALPDAMELDAVGVRDDSLLKLIVMARSGPSTAEMDDEIQAMSDDPSDRELHRRRPYRVCSAPEDTSAKESSAGETEREGDADEESRLARLAGAVGRERDGAVRHPRRPRTNSQGAGLTPAKGIDAISPLAQEQEVEQPPGCSEHFEAENTTSKALRTASPVLDDDGAVSEEDPSELSSGMIVCDLSNEFRKLKVRRHRLPIAPSGCRQRQRSKPRGETRERSSSEDNGEGTDEQAVVMAVLPARRGVSTRGLRALGVRSANGVARCSTCAFRIANPAYCRCGKTLCSRHRSAQAHSCPKLRQKMQQVSD